MALGLTQPLTEMSTRNISSGGKGGRCVRLTPLPPSYTDCLEIWESQPPGNLGASFTCSSAANPEVFSILWTANVHYRVHNSPPPVPILSQNNPLTARHSCMYKDHYTPKT